MHKRPSTPFLFRLTQFLRRINSSSATLQGAPVEPQPDRPPFQLDVVNTRVRWVAVSIADLDEFRNRADIVASEFGPTAIEQLAKLFHAEHSPPAELAAQFQGLGTWMAARQFAIFEIFYNFGGDSIPILQRVAYGDYDWTQGNAIEILCRLAADDVQREQIISGLVEHLPAMREEAHYYALNPLISQSKSNQKLNDVLSQLLNVPEFKQSHEYLSSS